MNKYKFTTSIILFFIMNSCFGEVSDLYPFTSATDAKRFATLTQETRCVICQNQNLADSNAPIANDLRTKIDEGNAFSKILVDPRFRAMLSGTICQIIISAEKSGNLAQSLMRIGENYEDKADITARNLETLLEPIVLVLIAIAVLFVALAVFLPIYSLIGSFNAGGK